MEHPSIAKVLDAGATPEGRPYFVMEYVPGFSISDYCDRRRLPIEKRLELFIDVCGAVQHAHQKAMIHRDLKPSNVLVQDVDGKPLPKIIDFGLAKAMGQRLTDMSLFTEVGTMVGTPAYMSPEQADRNERNIDTRTDVYSLGVILYELLVGRLPFESRDLGEGGHEAMLQRIRQQDPPRPSTKIRSLGDNSRDLALIRGEGPRSLESRLRGELDWITMKAQEKDRTRRYGSSAELAADIQRHLRDEPVLAGPPSARYRAAKFIRRHRFGVAVAVAAAVLLIGFATTMAIEARRLARERDRANRESAASQRVAEFMINMFKVSDPGEARGNTITAREILDKASQDIDTGLAKDPELQAKLLNVIGNVYERLGLFARAESLLTRALDIRRSVLGPQNTDTLTSMDDLGQALWQRGSYPESEKLLRETLDARRRILGPSHLDTLSTMSKLGLLLRLEERHPEAEKLFREVLEARRRLLGPEHRDTLKALNSLALSEWDQDHHAEAEKLHREALAGRRRVLGPEHPDTLMSMSNLAIVLDDEGRYAESEKLQRETLEIKNRVLGPEHPNTPMSRNNLAVVLREEGRNAEAEQLWREMIGVGRRVFGPKHPETLKWVINLGPTLSYERRYAEAENVFREVIQQASESSDKGSLASAWYGRACGAAVAGHPDVALQYLREAEDLGSSDTPGIATDDDLKSLRGDPRFSTLVARAKERAARARGTGSF